MTDAPAFNRGYRLRRDPVRGTPVVLAPERMITLNETSIAVLELVDGERTVAEIVAVLAARFGAPAELIATDVGALLVQMRDEGVIRP